jgi:acyl-CoA dehydrogenase
MDETGELLAATVTRLLEPHCTAVKLLEAERGVWPAALWAALEEAGLTRALLPEAAGGVGLESEAALALVRAVGRHAAPAPLAETMMAGWLLAGAGIAVPDGPLTILPARNEDGLGLTQEGEGWRIAGTVRRIPWGRHAVAAAALVERAGETLVALVPASGWTASPGANLALEPRDEFTLDAALGSESVAPAAPGTDRTSLRRLGAAMRSLAIAGALETVLKMTVDYAQQRVQFGRPIGKFQAIQQNLAILAGQTVAAGAAADIAAAGFAAGLPLADIAAAKARAGEAASIAAGIAHQVHGAIGFTHEHSLHFFTKRLWSWRDEFGTEAEWNLALGRLAAAAGADRLWSDVITA